jgi:Ca-activated chloride channel family protein
MVHLVSLFSVQWRQLRRPQRVAVLTGWIVLVCALTGPAYAQNSDARVSITPRAIRQSEVRSARTGWFRTDAERVFIPVMVTDPSGRPVQGLRKQDFRLADDGVQQELADFFIEDGPASIGIVLDASGSMRNKLPEAQQAVREFLGLSAQDDEFFLVSFQDRPELVHKFTTNVKSIEADVEAVQPDGWTALYDAIYTSVSYMKQASRSRRVLLVLSDGEDNNSRYTEAEMRDLVREADVRIFSISIQSHTPALDRIAAESGGHAYRVRKIGDLPEVGAKISAEVHAQYILGFNPPTQQRDGKYHNVKVELVQPGGDSRLYVAWRHGYYAPFD